MYKFKGKMNFKRQYAVLEKGNSKILNILARVYP